MKRRDLLRRAAAGAAALAAAEPAYSAVSGPISQRAENAVRQLREILPSNFDPAYIEHAVVPFLRTSVYEGERPALPMIDVALSKENALPQDLWGMLYDGWQPNPEEEGLTVFLQGLDKRGPDNLRKKIYFAALTPDLYGPCYAEKVAPFFDRLFDQSNAGKPIMSVYLDNYFDLYWDLHLGVKGDQVPKEVRQIGYSFNTVLAHRDPLQHIVYENYMKVRQLRPMLKEWIDQRIKDLKSGKTPNPEKTFAFYWIKNGEETGHFREKDVVFECFHNFVALSQWGNTIYNIMARLDPVKGDPATRQAFRATMAEDYDKRGSAAFTPLERFVMELFRVISPNSGSISAIKDVRPALYDRNGYMVTPHTATSFDATHWSNPDQFDPNRYLSAPTSSDAAEKTARAIGFAASPFESVPFHVTDGRNVELTNSTFGTVFGVAGGTANPVCDYAGFAPFGFGYRRCPGEQFTIKVFEDFLKKVWADKIVFQKLEVAEPRQLPIGPNTVIADTIGFTRRSV